MKTWTNEEDLKLINLVENGKITYIKMLPFFNDRSVVALRARAQKLGVKNGYHRYIYTLDQHFFSKPVLENCYYAGVFAADAAIVKRGEDIDHYSFKWTISVCDRKMMEAFNVACRYNGPIASYMSKSPSSENVNEMISIQIHRIKQWKIDLEKNFSIVPNKTKILSGPNLTALELKLAFLIGYIDGDGCITGGKKSGVFDNLTISVTSSSYKVLEWIKDTINSLSLSSSRPTRVVNVTKLNSSNCYVLRYSGVRAIKIFELLNTVPVSKLDRKWNNPAVLDYIARRKAERPEWFTESINDIIKRLGLNFNAPEINPEITI